MTAAALLSSILPSDLRSIIEFPLIALGAILLVLLIRLFIPKRWGRQHVRILWVICAFFILCGIAAFVFGALFSFLVWKEEHTVALMGSMVTLLFSGAFGWLAWRTWRKSLLLRSSPVALKDGKKSSSARKK
jgi:hypothetical protein